MDFESCTAAFHNVVFFRHYTDEVLLDAPIPNVDASEADIRLQLPPDNVMLPYEESFDGDAGAVVEMRKGHRVPKLIWYSLHSTAPKVCYNMYCIPLTNMDTLLSSKIKRFASSSLLLLFTQF